MDLDLDLAPYDARPSRPARAVLTDPDAILRDDYAAQAARRAQRIAAGDPNVWRPDAAPLPAWLPSLTSIYQQPVNDAEPAMIVGLGYASRERLEAAQTSSPATPAIPIDVLPPMPEPTPAPVAAPAPVQTLAVTDGAIAAIRASAARAGAQRGQSLTSTLPGVIAGPTEAQQQAEADRMTRATLDTEIRRALVDTTGDKAGGASIGWRPWPTVSYSAIVGACERANLAPPSAPSAAAVAGEAVRAMSRAAGYRVDTVRRGSHWRVFRASAVAAIGDSIGTVKVDVRLTQGRIEVDHDGTAPAMTLAVEVREAFARARAACDIEGPALARWADGVIGALRGIPSCLGRYWIPGPAIARWEAIAAALASIGCVTVIGRWTSASDVREDLAIGLRSEVTTAIARITSERDRAREGGKADIGTRGATSAVVALRDLRQKLDVMRPIVGPMEDERRQLADLDQSLASLADDTAIRGAMLEMYDEAA